MSEQLQELDLVFSRTGLIFGTPDKITEMWTEDGFDEIFQKASEFSCMYGLTEDLLQNFQNSDTPCKIPKRAQQVTSCLR